MLNPSEPADGPRSQKLILILLALVAYSPTLRVGFLWDDHVMIEQNPRLEHWSLAALKHDFTTDVFEGQGDAYYRPAQTISDRIDYTLWKLRPIGYHLTNLAAHVANTLLFQSLILALGFTPLTALLAASLFAVHPIGVEQLMIIAGRAELFGLTFTLAAILCVLRDDAWAWIGGTLFYVIGLFFKESVVVAPLLAALTLGYARRPLKSYVPILPWIALTPLYLWLRSRAVGPALPDFSPATLWLFFSNAFPLVIWKYLQLILIPWNLHSHRLMPHITHSWGWIAAASVMVVAGLLYLNARLTSLCVGWFVLSLLPKVPSMYAGNFMLDHWAYAALPGVLLALAVFFDRQWVLHKSPLHRALMMLYFPFLIGWALLVHLNVELRGSDEKMYRWALHFTTSHPIRYNLAITLMAEHRPLEALPYLEDVHADYPDDAKADHALALAYWQTGHLWLAHDKLVKLVARHPDFLPARQSLQVIELKLPRRAQP